MLLLDTARPGHHTGLDRLAGPAVGYRTYVRTSREGALSKRYDQEVEVERDAGMPAAFSWRGPPWQGGGGPRPGVLAGRGPGRRRVRPVPRSAGRPVAPRARLGLTERLSFGRRVGDRTRARGARTRDVLARRRGRRSAIRNPPPPGGARRCTPRAWRERSATPATRPTSCRSLSSGTRPPSSSTRWRCGGASTSARPTAKPWT